MGPVHTGPTTYNPTRQTGTADKNCRTTVELASQKFHPPTWRLLDNTTTHGSLHDVEAIYRVHKRSALRATPARQAQLDV